MKIWVDDQRDPNKYRHSEYVWFKCAREFIQFIQDNHRPITHIHLDHYLDDWSTLTGLDLLFMIEDGLSEGQFENLEEVYVHTGDADAAEKYFIYCEDDFKNHKVKLIRSTMFEGM